MVEDGAIHLTTIVAAAGRLSFFLQGFRLCVRPPLVSDAPLQPSKEAAIEVSHKESGDVLHHVVKRKTLRFLVVSDDAIPDMTR